MSVCKNNKTVLASQRYEMIVSITSTLLRARIALMEAQGQLICRRNRTGVPLSAIKDKLMMQRLAQKVYNSCVLPEAEKLVGKIQSPVVLQASRTFRDENALPVQTYEDTFSFGSQLGNGNMLAPLYCTLFPTERHNKVKSIFRPVSGTWKRSFSDEFKPTGSTYLTTPPFKGDTGNTFMTLFSMYYTRTITGISLIPNGYDMSFSVSPGFESIAKEFLQRTIDAVNDWFSDKEDHLAANSGISENAIHSVIHATYCIPDGFKTGSNVRAIENDPTFAAMEQEYNQKCLRAEDVYPMIQARFRFPHISDMAVGTPTTMTIASFGGYKQTLIESSTGQFARSKTRTSDETIITGTKQTSILARDILDISSAASAYTDDDLAKIARLAADSEFGILRLCRFMSAIRKAIAVDLLVESV